MLPKDFFLPTADSQEQVWSKNAVSNHKNVILQLRKQAAPYFEQYQ
jgi:hypothetical protein